MEGGLSNCLRIGQDWSAVSKEIVLLLMGWEIAITCKRHS